MCRILREEFRPCKMGLWFRKADSFYTTQWEWPIWILLVYRLLMTCYVSAWTVYLFVEIPKTGEHPTLAYFTQWAYLLLLSYQASGLAVLIYHTNWKTKSGDRETREVSDVSSETIRGADPADGLLDGKEPEPVVIVVKRPPNHSGLPPPVASVSAGSDGTVADNLSWDIKSLWLLQSMSSVCGLAVTFIYVCILLPMMLSYDATYTPGSLDVNLHVVNSGIILLDHALVAIPIRVLHVIYPVSFALLYIVFSAIYWAIDNERNVLYPVVLDWNYPGKTLGAVLGVNCILLPLLHLFLFGVYTLRGWIYRRCYGRHYLST